jgi:hypothetical protein
MQTTLPSTSASRLNNSNSDECLNREQVIYHRLLRIYMNICCLGIYFLGLLLVVYVFVVYISLRGDGC